MFEDDVWIQSLTEAQAVSEERITHHQSELDLKKKVRPVQIGEFVRKYVSRRRLGTDGVIVALTAARRQLGVGAQGGAGGLAIFHHCIFDEWTSGTLDTPPARFKVDEKMFRNDLIGVRCETQQAPSPKRAAVAEGKHCALSFVQQEGVQPIPKNHGAEQGNVDGPPECSLAIGTAAAEGTTACCSTAGRRNPSMDWAHDKADAQRLQDEQRCKMQKSLFSAWRPGKAHRSR